MYLASFTWSRLLRYLHFPGSLAAIWTIGWAVAVVPPTIGTEVLPTSKSAPVPNPHFPDAVHAVVWRNWGLVPVARLADVIEATPEKVVEIATSMGLPREAPVPPRMLERGYITLIRRNWHLLPYEQLLKLLGISADELAFRLREDDFLSVKLGPKPLCSPVKYQEPDAETRRRVAAIRSVVRKDFGDLLDGPDEPRFAFIGAFDRPADRVNGKDEATNRDADELPRFIYSYCAMFGDPLATPELDSLPDGLLAELRGRGVNGVWLHTVLRQLAPGGEHFPEFGEGREARLANLRRLVERAAAHGIDIYLYVNEPRAMPHRFFETRQEMAGVREGEYAAMCTSDPRVRRWLADSLAHVFQQVPGLGGVFTITASENLTNCASHGRHADCPRCAKRTASDLVAEVNRAVVEGVHRSAPRAKVIAWDWGWGWAWQGNHDEALATIAKLPEEVWLMSISEWSLPIERGGVKSEVGEYSISAVGPGPRAKRHWEAARQRGLKTAAKVQLNNTWELASIPYLPVMDLVAQHCQRLARSQIDGMMLSWSLGGYPSLNLELASKFAAQPIPDAERALQELAEKHFGPRGAPHVRQAWTKFSRAFQEYPYSGAVLYNGPQQIGPANLLYARPTGYRATMVGFPYDDLNGWRGPYPPQVFAEQFEKVAGGWAEGLTHLEAAQSFVPPEMRPAAAADLRVAQAAGIHFASVANQARFIMARDAFMASSDVAQSDELRAAIAAILDREVDLARSMFKLSSADSRLGFEASNHYFYVPHDFVEKVLNCEHLKHVFQPASP